MTYGPTSSSSARWRFSGSAMADVTDGRLLCQANVRPRRCLARSSATSEHPEYSQVASTRAASSVTRSRRPRWSVEPRGSLDYHEYPGNHMACFRGPA